MITIAGVAYDDLWALKQALANAQPPVYQSQSPQLQKAPTPPVTQSAGVAAEIAGLIPFTDNIPWQTPGQIDRRISAVIDAQHVWLARFTPTANSTQTGRIQVSDAQSQSIFRTYLLCRGADVLAKQEGISVMFTYWVGPGNPDPTGTWCAQFEIGVPYTVAVFNRSGVTESGQAALDIYQ